MKNTILAAVAAVGVLGFGGIAQAATFAGFSETADVYYNDAADFDYDPLFLGGSITEVDFLLDLVFSEDLSTGSLLLTDPILLGLAVLEGSLQDTMLQVDNDVADDTFALLFSLTTGATDYAIATFTGNLDGSGLTDFSTEGVFFEPGTLRIVGAASNQTQVVPLPASLPLLLAGVGGLALARRRRD